MAQIIANDKSKPDLFSFIVLPVIVVVDILFFIFTGSLDIVMMAAITEVVIVVFTLVMISIMIRENLFKRMIHNFLRGFR